MLLKPTPSAIKQALAALQEGKVIAFATDTVYALACDAKNDAAINRLYQLKARSIDKPIALLVKNLSVAKTNFFLSKKEEKIAQNFMPGSLTMVVHKLPGSSLSEALNPNSKTIGFRIPNHDLALKLLAKCDMIAATSANLSNQPPAIDAQSVINYFGDKIALVIDGGICRDKIASTVIKLTADNIQVLRSGLISQAQIENKIQ
jgi:L-threonylcarbamoyladenylate synthase